MNSIANRTSAESIYASGRTSDFQCCSRSWLASLYLAFNVKVGSRFRCTDPYIAAHRRHLGIAYAARQR